MLTELEKHDLCNAAIEKKKDLEWNYLELGAMLYRIREERLYDAGWSSWEEYAMEFRMSASSISRLIGVYEVFVLKYEYEHEKLSKAGGWTILAEMLPVIKKNDTKERADELIEMAIVNTRENIRRNLRDAKEDGQGCEHAHTHKVVIEVCDDCKDEWRVS